MNAASDLVRSLVEALDRAMTRPEPAWQGAPDGHLALAQDTGGQRRRVLGGRRRKADSPAGGRERADAPTRDDRPAPSGGGLPPMGEPPTGYGGGSSGGGMYGGGIPGGGLPSGGLPISPKLVILLLVFLCVCGVPFFVLMSQMGGGSSGLGDLTQLGGEPADQEAAAPPSSFQMPTAAPAGQLAAPLELKPEASTGDKWLVMLYQDADDKVLEKDIYVDLNEAERVGSSDLVKVVAQIDRFRGGYRGGGDWTTAKRFLVAQDDDLQNVRSPELADLGEVDMSDPAVLVDFVQWAVATYPADKYALILSDHGMGWPGGWTDPDPPGGRRARAPIQQAIGDALYLNDIEDALAAIREQTGVEQLELIGMDACLMAHAEVMSSLAPYARYAVFSQETEPALGWAYAAFLNELRANPGMSGGDLGKVIVDTYISHDQRIVDEEARGEFLGRAYGLPSAAQVSRQLSQDITLAAVDLGAMPEVMNRLNDLAFALQDVDQRAVAQARQYAQGFTSIWGQNVPKSYIDVVHFTRLLQESAGGRLKAPGDALVAAVASAIVAEKHGSNKPGATGLSIYFPNSALYKSPVAGPQSYTAVARRFSQDSSWDDFLAFHYTGRRFQPAADLAVVPDRAAQVVAPGAGEITVSPILLSANSVTPGDTVTMSADIDGDNIGYIKLLVAYQDAANNSLALVDMDYIESGDTRELNGVYYPDWGEGAFTLDFEWEPVVFAVSDGSTSAPALLVPRTYGATDEDATYAVDGLYTFANGSGTRAAQLILGDGNLRQVLGFNNDDGTGAAKEIVPQPGDTFTVRETWLDLDQAGNLVGQATEPGRTLTFGDQPWTWEALDAAAGQYLVGFAVEDLDGQAKTVFAPVTVR